METGNNNKRAKLNKCCSSSVAATALLVVVVIIISSCYRIAPIRTSFIMYRARVRCVHNSIHPLSLIADHRATIGLVELGNSSGPYIQGCCSYRHSHENSLLYEQRRESDFAACSRCYVQRSQKPPLLLQLNCQSCRPLLVAHNFQY